MSSLTSQIPKEFKELSAKARIEYVQGLWDFIAKTPDQVPIPESHKRVLDQRLAAYEATSKHLTDIVIESQASLDIEEAARWYEAQQTGLGVEFVLEIDITIGLRLL